MKTFRNSLLILALGTMTMGAFAQSSTPGAGATDKNHPRVDQVNDRSENQQDRIANGIKNGSLTPGEAARLEKGEQRLNRNERRDLRKNDGHLTKKEQAQLNREQNRLSKRIYRDKHNGAHQ